MFQKFMILHLAPNAPKSELINTYQLAKKEKKSDSGQLPRAVPLIGVFPTVEFPLATTTPSRNY